MKAKQKSASASRKRPAAHAAKPAKATSAEKVAHVAAGSRWFAWCCARAGLEAEAAFAALIARHAPGAVKGPFNTAARLAAGFSAAELARLEAAA